MYVCLCIVSSCPCIVKNSEAPDVCVCMCWFLYLSVVYVSMVAKIINELIAAALALRVLS